MGDLIIPDLSKLLFRFIILALCIQIVYVCAEHIYENEEKYKLLDEWRSPGLEMERNFTYYLAGHDYYGRPVWVQEGGKWLVSRIPAYIAKNVDSPKNNQEFGDIWDTFVDQMMFRLHNSPVKFSKKYQDKVKSDSISSDGEQVENAGKIHDGWVLVVNLDGYDLKELANPEAIAYGLRFAKKLEAASSNMEYGYFVNVNYFASTFIDILRPLLGNTLTKVDIYGTRSQVWKPKLLKKIPNKELSVITGEKNNPVIAYG